jgi:glutamyl-tRNA reductase
MSYLCISFTHKNTDIQTREKLAFSDQSAVETFLKTILDNAVIREAVLLSTCNRVEIIAAVNDLLQAKEKILKALSNYSQLDFEDLSLRADMYENSGAIHHLFTVASSLDSLVIGETQIVGQLKDAYRLSLAKGYCAQAITRAMTYAFKCAAKVRTVTSLGSGSVSVASTAVAKAKEIIGQTQGVNALVIGAGQMSELTIKHLLASGFDVILLSRNLKKARLLAQSFERPIIVEPYEKINQLLNEVPVMVTATSAPYAIIKQDMVKECSFSRYWFDIAVPRDIDEIESSNLHIFAVDDLQEIVNENMSTRAHQAKQAYMIINELSNEFFDWLKSLEIEPVVKHLYIKANDVIEKRVALAIKKGFVDGDNEENIKKLCQSVLNEFLHQPTTQLKGISRNMQCDVVLGSIQSIFGIENETNMFHECEHAIKLNN